MTKLTDFISEVRGRLEAATPDNHPRMNDIQDLDDRGLYRCAFNDGLKIFSTDIAKLLHIVEIYHEAITYFLGPTRDFKEPKLREALALAESLMEDK